MARKTFALRGGDANGKISPPVEVNHLGEPPKWLHVVPTITTETGDKLEGIMKAADKGIMLYHRKLVNPPDGNRYWVYMWEGSL